MSKAYDPPTRTLTTTYAVPVADSRWFIPFNSDDTTANQLAQCQKLVGTGKDDSVIASESVAS